MKRHLLARLVQVALSSFFLLTCATPAFSQEQEGFAKVGGYAGMSGVLDFTFDGVSFDGDTYYQRVGGEEIVILPRLDKQTMFRGILGYRASKGAFELSYERTHHNGTFGDMPVESTFQAVNVDGRFYFLTSGRLQPHVLFGGSIPWLTVENGSFLDSDVGDARWRGFGVNTEAGVTVYPHPRFGVSAGYSYRVIWFDRATGVTDEFAELRPRFRETSRGAIVTALFTF
jgi:Outer membrane protein beta-barrel domain